MLPNKYAVRSKLSDDNWKERQVYKERENTSTARAGAKLGIDRIDGLMRFSEMSCKTSLEDP